jgi:hypothetical protein
MTVVTHANRGLVQALAGDDLNLISEPSLSEIRHVGWITVPALFLTTTRSSARRVVCHERRLSMTVRNCTRDEGGPFEVGNQVLISSHRKLLLSKAMVVSVAEKPGQDTGRQG